MVCPGAIETAIDDNTKKRNLDQEREPVDFPEGKIPLTDGEPGTSKQVADLVSFLASDRASHITGTPIWIDGAESLLMGTIEKIKINVLEKTLDERTEAVCFPSSVLSVRYSPPTYLSFFRSALRSSRFLSLLFSFGPFLFPLCFLLSAFGFEIFFEIRRASFIVMLLSNSP